MNWSPNTSHHTRQARAQMLYDIRAFFLQRKVLEVETPALSMAANTDPYIASIECCKDINNKYLARYLHTSPEYSMKRLLASGSGDIYQICKVWREGESGTKHNPEFTLLEWYRVGFGYQQLMQEVEELFYTLIPALSNKSKYYSYEQLFLDKFSLNPHISSKDSLIKCVTENIGGLRTSDLSRQDMLDVLLTHCIEPDFKSNSLTFVYDYPESQSALAQLGERDGYKVAERFEVYLGNSELGNGYQEETNYLRNKQILQDENNARIERGMEAVKEDTLFLQACEAGIPDSAGIAIGLDRVLMCITGEKSIQKVINFPWDKA